MDSGNFLGISGGAGAAGAVRDNRVQARPTDRAGTATSGSWDRRPDTRPQERPDWNARAQDRNADWSQRVDNRHESWNQWQKNGQQRRDDFTQNREQRWNELQAKGAGNWRNQSREDWQEHREDLWDYRYDRADEVWDDVRDYHDDMFDDHWWGHSGWGYHGSYPVNPWWWWAPVTWYGVSGYVYADAPPPPIYTDYGTTNKAAVGLAVNVEQQPPPLPPAAGGGPAEWLPLGVFALVQEEKGDPNAFLQLSVNRDGVISGAYQNTATGNQKPVAGQVDKKTQNVSWRIGENRDTICSTTLANLTEDVSVVALRFSPDRVENWLLVRLPEPAPEGQPPKAPERKRAPPPVQPAPAPAPAAS